MSKHTPGPWIFSGDMIYAPMHRITISLHHDSECSESEAEANSKLIAAAPDLLSKLKGLIDAAEYLQSRVVETRGANCMDNLDFAVDEAKKAIFEATGEA